MFKVYLSGGFRSNWQERVINELNGKFIFFNPRDHQLVDSKEYTCWDNFFVRNCDILFAYMESSNPSGYGLTLETGMAKALQKTIILVDERSGSDQDFENYFQIVRNSADVVFESIEKGMRFLNKFNMESNHKTFN